MVLYVAFEPTVKLAADAALTNRVRINIVDITYFAFTIQFMNQLIITSRNWDADRIGWSDIISIAPKNRPPIISPAANATIANKTIEMSTATVDFPMLTLCTIIPPTMLRYNE